MTRQNACGREISRQMNSWRNPVSKNISEKLRELRVFADGEADTPYEYFMLFVIVVNCACLGIDTSENLTQGFRNILFWTDKICLGIFILDLLFKMIVYNKEFFGERKIDENGEPYFFVNKWNISDALIVFVSIFSSLSFFAVFRAFRLFRSLRVLRAIRSMRAIKSLKLVNSFAELRHTFTALIRAIPCILWTFFFLAIFSYTYAIIGTNVFGKSFPVFFGNLGASLLTLCQIMTFDSWVSAVARPVGNVFPFSWIYFVSYSFTSAYVIMNFIVGVIVDFMREKQEMRTGSQI